MLVDIDTGVLRPGRVLVLRSPVAELFLGSGPMANKLIDFAFDCDTNSSPFFAACEQADRALEHGDFITARALGANEHLAEIKSRPLRRLALIESIVGKASPDDPDHPGWPAGTPGGLGGKFMPKDKSPEAGEATEQKLKRLKALREFRAAAQAALVLLCAIPLEGVPGVDIAASIKTVVELGRIAIDLGNDEREINRAIEFVNNGPYKLDALQVRGNGDIFSSFDGFKKISLIEAILRAYGTADAGKEWHHIVEQGGDNADNFTAEQLHSTKNIIPLPGPIHDLVTAEYAQEYDKSGKTVREWLQGQSFEDQWNEGVKILRKLGIVK
ncbi:MAG TPA: hypothetical protein VNF99_20190 [Stellaceae bacterium]|nr:hypothetical protein [Stellaceae bacterium]